MRTQLLAIALFGLSAASVLYYPSIAELWAAPTPPATNPDQPPVTGAERPTVEAVFVLDTTGSMGGLIQAAKEKIWSIASSLAQAQPTPEIRLGLVAYRDRGDAYVTQVVELSTDLDSLYAKLMDFQAEGGGDGPESVNQALYDAVHRIQWSQDPKAYRVLFLVGDAPPHMDYQDDVKYPVTLKAAKDKGILVNTVQCGSLGDTQQVWRKIAQNGGGRYFQVEQAGGAVAIATPYDKPLAELAAKLDATRLYYGSAEERATQERKQEAAAKLRAGASVESQARRASFNAAKGGEANFLGHKELVDEVSSGRVDIATIPPAALPAPLQDLTPEQRKALVEENAQRREALRQEVDKLTKQRDDYLRDKVEAAGGAKDSLDHKLYGAVREQAADKGLRYEAEAPRY